MKITVNINNAKETVQTVNLDTAGTQAVVLQAQPKVNYQLVDQATGFAPENIATKRVGNDLHIAFEGSDISQPDLIIEGYYNNDNTELLVGMHENGQLYAYVPETGLQSDAVSLLAEEMTAGQALGGQALSNALWAFSPWWLLALVPLAAAAIAAGSGGSGGGSKAATPETPATTEKTTKPTVVLTNKDTDGDGQDDTTTISGKTDPNADVTITLPDGRTITTKANDKGEYSVDVPKLNEGDKVTVTAKAPGKETSDPTEATVDTAADKPEVVANDDGSVTSTPGKDSVKNTTKYTDEDDNEQIITATKQPDGTWKATDKDGNELPTAPDANNPKQPWVDPTTGTVTLPPDAVKDNTPVEATSTDANNNTADDDATSKNDPKNAKVISSDSDNDGNPDGVTTTTTPVNEGEELVTKIKLDNNNGVDNLVIGINSPDTTGVDGADFDLTNVTFTNGVTSNGDGTVNVPPGVTEFEIRVPVKADNTTEGDETGKVAVGNPDGSVVEGNEFTVTDSSKTPAEKPTVTPSTTDGSVSVVPGPNNTSTTVTFTGEDGKPKTVTITKQPDGSWTVNDPDNTGATITDPTTGEVKIPQDSSEDESEVTAIGKETGKNDSEPVKADVGTDSKDAKVDNSNNDGVVTTSVNEGEVQVTTVKLTNNNGAELTLDDVVGSANADDFETLEFSNNVTVDSNGKIIVPAGVKEFTISMKTVEDSTTEGDETVQFTIGGVTGNEATIKDTSTTPVPPTTIKSLDMADNLTDENKVLINGQEMAPETVYPNSNATYGVGQVASGNGDTALSLATGLTNDRNVNLLINLEGPLGDGQTLEVVRYTIVNGNRTNAENVTANITKVDDKTYQVAGNDLPQTFGTDYQYEVVLKTNGVEAGKQTYDFRLDSEVEGLDVTKANVDNGNLQLELTARDNSEKGAFVYAQWNSGGTVQSVQFVGTNGVYTANLQGFNYKDPAGLTLTIVDAAGNVSSQKVNLIRNLFSEYNENLGPDTTKTNLINDGGYDDANRISGRQQVTGAPNGVLATAGNDTLIIGMDQFGDLNALNGSLSDEGGVVNSRLANINTGAGDDYILVRGIMQAFEKDATIQMGDGNDKFQVNDAIVGYVANPKFQIDMGEGNNIINIKKYIGSVVQSTVTFGSGNDMFLMGENWDGAKNINFGAGDDILNIGGYINNIANTLASEINFGEGNDQMIVGTNIDDLNLILNFGDGNNYLQVNESFVTGKANFGGGDDVVVLNNFSRGTNLGSNTDNLQLNMGAGNDQVTINGRAYRGLVDMGDGDDTLTVNETYLDSNTNQLRLEGGAGNDTIVLNGSTDDHSMRWIKNFETVDMKSSSAAQTLRVTLNYLEQDDNVQALYIKGGSEDKVKLGTSDGNLEDNSKGGAAVTWTKMDAMQKTVDGVTYDAYTVSSSTEWVYIQQGVQVV